MTVGLQRRARKHGHAFYWSAAAVSRHAGDYPGPKIVRLRGATDEERSAECEAHTAALRQWLDNAKRHGHLFTGTFESLVECYRRDDVSTYRDAKPKTRRQYDHSLRLALDRFSGRRIADLTGRDFAAFYRDLRAPAESGGLERIARAYTAIKCLRIVLHYGASVGYDGCAAAAGMLSHQRYEAPPPRESALSYDQARAIIDTALASGRRSVAIAQALQFELGLRQIDIIGEWHGEDVQGGIVAHGRRWAGGIVWQEISGGILRKRTSKTGAVGEWDLTLCPLVLRALGSLETAGSVGPLVIDEGTGRPYSYRAFARAWRAAADEAGVPRGVWNMDSRAGGITEGADAGAAIDDLRQLATHSDGRMTGRYVRRRLEATRRVADLRALRRERGS